MKNSENQISNKTLLKAKTGIQGLDEITGGGLPACRPTLVCGSAGCGKTILAMEFIVRGASQFKEPGVFMSFEETDKELTSNVASLGFDLDSLVKNKKLVLDFVQIERSEIQETGEYDLEGLFIRLGHAIDSIGAKRVVLDTIEVLFSGFTNQMILRAEIRRLFRWLKEKGVTAIITGEKGDETLTRQGLEEYVSDCVIVLDHRVSEQASTRRLRIVKYRGSVHGTNEYPFIIDSTGFSVLPVTSLELNHTALHERISSGVPALDEMLSGKGFYRGSSVLVSGTAGVGKSSLAAHFALAACKRGEKVLYFCFEESPSQLMRNMNSIGIDLEPWTKKGLLHFHASRPTLYGIEMHLVTTHKLITEFKPHVVIVDPVNSFIYGDKKMEVKLMLIRLVDFLKVNRISALFTSLTASGTDLEHTDVDISSIIDSWLLLRDIEISGERNRGIYILKSRGMAHSNQIREFIITDKGIELQKVYVGPGGVLTGTARVSQEAAEKEELQVLKNEIERKKRELERKRIALEAQVAALQADFESEQSEALKIIETEKNKIARIEQDKSNVAKSRKAHI